MKQLTAPEAQSEFEQLLDQVEAGEEVFITRNGRTVARLSAVPQHALQGQTLVDQLAEIRQILTDENVHITLEEAVAWSREGRR